MPLTIQRQKQRVEDAETSFLEWTVIKDVGRMPSDLSRLGSLFFHPGQATSGSPDAEA